MVDAKTLGWIQVIGAVIAGWMGWQAARWDTVILAVVFLFMGFHHFGDKGKRR